MMDFVEKHPVMTVLLIPVIIFITFFMGLLIGGCGLLQSLWVSFVHTVALTALFGVIMFLLRRNE